MPYELVQEEVKQPSLIQGIARQPIRVGSKLATRAAGLPGDVLSLVNQFIAGPTAQAITGKKALPYEETFIGKAIPTTEQHRAALRSKTGEFLEPQNKVEKFVDDVIEDTALLFVPGGKVAKGIKAVSPVAKTGRNLAKSVGANLLGETAEQVSGSKEAGAFTKAGALFLSSILDAPSAAKQVGNLYKTAEKNLPSGATTSAGNLSSNMSSLKKSVTKGRPENALSPPEKFVINQIDKVESLVKDGKISVEQAVAQKRSLNQELASLWKDVPGKKDQQTVKSLAKQINAYLNKTIEEYGRTNPKFYKPYKDADQAFGTLARSNLMSKWAEKNLATSPVTHGLLHLFGSPIGAVGAAAIPPYQAAKLVYRVGKSPALREIYSRTLRSAAREDATAFNKYVKELDDALQKQESKDRFEFID